MLFIFSGIKFKMVLLNIKINDKNQFLIETTVQNDCTDVIKEVVLGQLSIN